MGVFVPKSLVLNRCEATNLGVLDPRRFAPLNRGCANSGVFGAKVYMSKVYVSFSLA